MAAFHPTIGQGFLFLSFNLSIDLPVTVHIEVDILGGNNKQCGVYRYFGPAIGPVLGADAGRNEVSIVLFEVKPSWWS